MKNLKKILLTGMLGLAVLGILNFSTSLGMNTSLLNVDLFESDNFISNTESIQLSSTDYDITCDEYAIHEHSYENTTVADTGYEIYAQITKFRIYLHDDFMENADLDNVWCSAPGAYTEDCINTSSKSTSDGGMTITYYDETTADSDAEEPNYIEWEYGLINSGDAPTIAGYNNYTDGTSSTKEEREIYESIKFVFDESVVEGEATTSAAVWIQFWEYDQTDGSWTPVEEDDVPGTTDYHWNTEGGERSTTYYCPGCASLTIEPSTHSIDDLYSTVEYVLTATGTEGEDLTEELTYDWRAYADGTSYVYPPSSTNDDFSDMILPDPNADGTFKTKGRFGFWSETGDNYIWDTSRYNVQFGETNPGDTITVVSNEYPDVCYTKVEFPDEPVCDYLTLDPVTHSVDDLYSTIEYNVTAISTDGDDITDILTYDWRAYDYGSFIVYPMSTTNDDSNVDADGSFKYEIGSTGWWLNTGNNYRWDTEDSTVRYGETSPGDIITVVSNEFPNCSAKTEYPYCEDLDIIEPASPSYVGTEAEYETPIEIEVEASTGEEWPYEVTYSSTDSTSTFTDNTGTYSSPYTPTPRLNSLMDWMHWWIDSYWGGESGTITVQAEDDVAGLCSDTFTYTLYDWGEPYCMSLEITNPSGTIPAADMEAGDVLIEWTTSMSDGSAAGPWEVWSIDSSGAPSTGTFTDPAGNPLGDYDTSVPSYLSGSMAMYYNGEPGDTIFVRDINWPDECFDFIDSEEAPEEEEFFCTDMTLDGPYLADGTLVDLTVDSEIENMFAENYICYEYEITVEDPSWTGLMIGGSDGTGTNLELTVDQTGYSSTGSSFLVALYGSSTFTGTLCASDFHANETFSLYVYGEDPPCGVTATLPIRPMACQELYMDPDSVTMTADATDAGIIDITVEIQASSPAWYGDLVIEATDASGGAGSGTLKYADGSSGGSLLTMPVSGTLTVLTATYEGGQAGDTVVAYVDGEELECEDEFPITQEGALACYDLYFDQTSVLITGEANQNLETVLTLDSDLEDQTLIVTYTGCGGTIEYAGASYSDVLTVTGIAGSDTFELNFTDLCIDASIHAYIDGWEGPCEAEILPYEEALYCEDLSFDVDTVTLEEGEPEDVETTLTLTSDIEDQTLYVEFSGCDEYGNIIEYDGTSYSDTLEITGIDGNSSWDLTFIDVCEDASIYAYIDEWEDRCADQIVVYTDYEELACYDLSFDVDEDGILEGEDLETELNLNSDLEDQTLVINYDCDGDIVVEYEDEDGNDVTVEDDDQVVIEGIDGDASFDVTFEDVCEDFYAEAYIDGEEDDCYDELMIDVYELGDFEKYIYTFNFVSEKNSYTDEGIFFSHDEDRTFYTLEYDPAGGEETITFTDEMWDDDLYGELGSGENSGGWVELADSYDELTNSSVYGYLTIERFGFGSTHEANSDDLAGIVQNWDEYDYQTFVAYIQYDDGTESERILSCDYDYYDEDGDEVEEEDDWEERELISDEVCYDPEETPEDDGQVVIENAGEVEEEDDDAVIRVRYVGIVHSNLSCSSADDECLVETFENEAELEVYESVDPLEADAKLVVLCSYLVTRNAGDVFLEVALDSGSDISCIFDEDSSGESFSNTDALIIQDSGSDSDSDDSAVAENYSEYSVSFCDDDSGDGLISNLSSYVCEIITSVSDLWKSATVESTTKNRVSQATRNTTTNQSSSVNSFSNWNDLESTLKNQNNPNSGILYYDGTMSADYSSDTSLNAATLTLGSITVPDGAWTVIVENADLQLTGDIDYGGTGDMSNIPSIAFVVLGGDIHITTGAHELSGVFYTDQSFTGTERSAVDDPLTFYGSVYGNIQALLDAARYVGPPTLDGGGIVVRYDSRIILNTPPGLSEYVDINTQQGVN
jgi:hypothetical protein